MRRSRRASVLAAAVALAAVVLLAGCASATDATSGAAGSASTYTSPHAKALRSWFTVLNPRLSQVEKAITSAQIVVRRPDHRGLAAACQTLGRRVRAAQAAPSSPDTVVRTALRRSLSSFARAASDCVTSKFDGAGYWVDIGHYEEEIALRRLHVFVPDARV